MYALLSQKILIYFFIIITVFACKNNPENSNTDSKKSVQVIENVEHENPRMRFKVVSSKFLEFANQIALFEAELEKFTKEKYEKLKPFILEKSISTLQGYRQTNKFTYKELTLFYLYRIKKYESDPNTLLNAIISLNPNILLEAEKKDEEFSKKIEKIQYMECLYL